MTSQTLITRAALMLSALLSASCLVQPESDSPAVTSISSSVPESSSSQVQLSSSSVPLLPIDFCSLDSECSQGEYCELNVDPNTVSTWCDEAGRCNSVTTLIGALGTCQPLPEFCPEIYAPVCIDGTIYSSVCHARSAGVRGSYRSGECTRQDTVVTRAPIDTTSGFLFVRSGGGQLRAFINIITGDEAIPNPSVHMGVLIESMNYEPLNRTEWIHFDSMEEIPILLPWDYVSQDEPAVDLPNSDVAPSSIALPPPTELLDTGSWVSVWVLVPGQEPIEVNATMYPELSDGIARLEHLVRSVIPAP